MKEPPNGYHYTYETDSQSSDVELHGGVKSEVQSRTEEISVYHDAREFSPSNARRHQLPKPPVADARAWTQRPRQDV
jgi:hypothetical protein